APTLTAANSGSPASTENQGQAQKPAEPAAKPVSAGSADPVADLIAKVEKEYQAGQENYTAGHLEAARQNFDHAFDLLLSSNLEINTDPRLESEFDRILEGVNGFEMQALQQGDGFTEQKSEPAPIDEAKRYARPVDASLRAKAEGARQSTRPDLPLMMT